MNYNEFKSYVINILREQEMIFVIAGLAQDFKNNRLNMTRVIQQCNRQEPKQKKICIMNAKMNTLKNELMLYRRATGACNKYGDPKKIDSCTEAINRKAKSLEDKIKTMTTQIPKV